MTKVAGGRLRAACGAMAAVSALADVAHGAIVHRGAHWSAPDDGLGLVIDLELLRGSSGPAAICAWHIQVLGESGLEFTRQDAGGAAGLVLYSAHPDRDGPGSLPLALVVRPLSEFGFGHAHFGSDIGRWRLNDANRFGFQFTSRAGDVHCGWGRIDIGATSVIRAITEIAWQDVPDIGVQAGHTPAAGSLVLLGMASVIGGPRRERLDCHLRAHA